jgi:hypothetical protein
MAGGLKTMNRFQKIAWFNLAVITATILITSTAIAIEIHMRGYSTIGPCFVVILVLLRITPFLFKKPQGQSKVVCDERDHFILNRAVSFASAAFWYVLFLFCFLLFFIIGPQGSVPTITLPLIAFGGALFLKTAASVAILVQYGRSGDGNK